MRFSLFHRFIRWLGLALVVPLALSGADSTTYIFTTIAGNSPLRGPLQRLAWPLGLARDGAGMLYVADTDLASLIKVTPAGEVSVVAGKAGEYQVVDGPGATARFEALLAVAVDASGNLFA